MIDNLPKLDDIAEHETELLKLSPTSSTKHSDYVALVGSYDACELELESPLNTVSLVQYYFHERELILLLVAPSGPKCNLLPMLQLRPSKQRRATMRETEKIIRKTDGWMVATLVPSEQRAPYICFSVILKKAWQKVGKPHLIDTRIYRNQREKQES